MINIISDLNIKCSSCGQKYSFGEDDFEEPEVFTKERQIGLERHVKWQTEFECDSCPDIKDEDKGGHLIEVSIEGYELPIGQLSDPSPEVNVAGAVITEMPVLEALIEE